MADRNRWDDDRRWKSSSDYRDDDDDYENRGSRDYSRQRQHSQQDYSGEFDRDRGYGGGRWGSGSQRYSADEGYRSGQSYGASRSYEPGYTSEDRYRSGQSYGSQSYGSGQSYRSGQPYRDERGQYDERSQSQGRGYAGAGQSHYGPSSSATTGDYFTGSDYGSGAHAWDRGSTQGYAGSGRYGSTTSNTGFGGELGSTAAYAPGSRDRDTSRQSYQREMGGGYGQSSSYGQGGYERGTGYGQERGFLERASDEVMSWFGDEDAARRREQDHRGQGPSDYTRSDERIREDANDRLTDDWRVDARKISVTVSDGELTLSGTVPNRDAKRRAEDCVENISGVKHVQNNLRVDTTGGNALGTAGTTHADWGTSAAADHTTAGSKTSTTATTGTTGATSRGTTTGSTSA